MALAVCCCPLTRRGVQAAPCTVAANYMFFDGGCGAVGNLLLANLVSTHFYAAAATADVGSGDPGDCSGIASKCVGARCFQPTHALIASLCVLAVLASVVIACRNVGLYRQIKRNADLARHAATEATPSLLPGDIAASPCTSGEVGTTSRTPLLGALTEPQRSHKQP